MKRSKFTKELGLALLIACASPALSAAGLQALGSNGAMLAAPDSSAATRLVVTGPDGFVLEEQFPAGVNPEVSGLPAGQYSYTTESMPSRPQVSGLPDLATDRDGRGANTVTGTPSTSRSGSFRIAPGGLIVPNGLKSEESIR